MDPQVAVERLAAAPVTAVGRAPLRAWGLAILVTLATAGLGGAATDLGPWYRGLVQPWWKPPDVVFGPVWTVLYALIAWAGVRAWWRAGSPERRRRVWMVFLLNAALNVLWSVLFFTLRRPDWALVQIAVLAVSVAVMIAVASRHDRVAARMLLPYMAWVLFAASVNAGVCWLNPASGASA